MPRHWEFTGSCLLFVLHSSLFVLYSPNLKPPEEEGCEPVSSSLKPPPDDAGCSASLVLSADVPADDDFVSELRAEGVASVSDEVLAEVEELPVVLPFELVPDFEEADVPL